MRPSRRIPLLRGFVGASVATFVALASHVWVGGGMPGMLGIAVPWLLSLTVCTLLAGRRLSALRLSLSVLVSQLLFHALFVLGEFTPATGLVPHVHGARPLALAGEVAFAGEVALVPQDAGMWLAHGVAAVVTIVALHRGERILQALLAVASAVAVWLHRVVRVPVAVRPVMPGGIRFAVVAAPARDDPLLRSLRRRGPPLRLV
ncbi:hypothetical protein [Microbacterium sp. YJN-G]|uniref:hypothetical protein n=1 Tax=Microbacterium sp. YJN-G TaxID=2763257 RepID=UPI001878B0B8|nr:hypothetical protein [Microbacterium sp. YJN-G]